MATLQSYITQCRLFLHDANANFYSDTEITTAINSARERVVRDTGCLRTIQTTSIPIAPPAATVGTAVTQWTASQAETAGNYIFSNIFTYLVTQSGTSGTTAPPYPVTTAAIPPSTPFADGTAMIQYVQNAEIIPFASLTQGISTLEILNVNLYWGNSRIPMRWLPWRNFNAELRYWQNYIGRPICFSIYGQSTLYVAPVPDQTYVVELDTVVLPPALVNLSDVDTINDPFNTAPPYYACYQLKFKEQSFGESEIFKQKYIEQIQAIQVSIMTGRVPSPYSRW